MVSVRIGGQLAKIPRHSIWRYGLVARFKSSISIEPVINEVPYATVEEKTLSSRVSNPEALIAELEKYTKYFPKDRLTNGQIQSYKYLVRGSNDHQTIRVGIIYADQAARSRSKVVESLLADPLALENQVWYDPVKSRSRSRINKFVSLDSLGENQEKGEDLYGVQSPLLNAAIRPSFSESLQLIRSYDDSNIVLTEIQELDQLNASEYHYLINVATELEQLISSPYPKDIQSKILLNIIDNTEYSPFSSESTPVTFDTVNVQSHTIKIDSNLVYNGIEEFLKFDTKAGTVYIDSIQNSNILELYKAIVWYLKTHTLTQWLLHGIKFQVKGSIENNENLRIDLAGIKDQEINRYSQLVHLELQDHLIPDTRSFFKKNLAWWKLYYKNDNVEYDLKDFFNKSFMNNSIEKYNYLRGHIVSQLQNQSFANYSSEKEKSNPLFEMKYQLINQRLSTEIQPHVYKILGKAFTLYQLPISVISFLSYQYFDFSSNAAFALGLLGWVVGFNQVSKAWTAITSKWSNNLFEEVRLCVGKDCIEKGLLQEFSVRFEEEQKLYKIKQEVLKSIDKECKIKV
ncbi:uncharacterized protein CANTADRAFT_48457 [Suhomyces tanzawaensis NRRL Y-17324]|uniref:Mmc1 C-terminal domain-containing protein n=1 Tax=Suhomyces tanzawaensis NRRL Y-17324 TaxID=984487 RepID=A0A1E4SJM6_9ASCO|nr:uncharacterized protein CANTADRAFT_48457 [Suhomyces tanzawaensis NRRL Y-17324]ODV79637.1 hypothetical protein CANTADRAFT_48457 [Suhomyces tanzawaensis NRRL Y-17324]